MPYRPPHPCSSPGCGQLVQQAHCETHRGSQERDRGTSTERGYGARHRRWRKMVLRRDPVCVMCEQDGRTTAATVADHIKPINHGGARFDLSNGMALCASCHSGRKQREDIAARSVA